MSNPNLTTMFNEIYFLHKKYKKNNMFKAAMQVIISCEYNQAMAILKDCHGWCKKWKNCSDDDIKDAILDIRDINQKYKVPECEELLISALKEKEIELNSQKGRYYDM